MSPNVEMEKRCWCDLPSKYDVLSLPPDTFIEASELTRHSQDSSQIQFRLVRIIDHPRTERFSFTSGRFDFDPCHHDAIDHHDAIVDAM